MRAFQRVGLKRLSAGLALIALIYSLIAFNAFPGDSLMYHLPFSIRFWRLDPWPDYSGYFEYRYQGFPVLWRILLWPGLFFHEPRLFLLPNLLALFGLCWCARTYLFMSWPITVLACLCFPVSLYGFASSMQDFFTNCTALSGALALFAASLLTHRTKARQACAVGLGMLVLSANVKFQGLLLSITILLLATLFFLSSRWLSSGFSLTSMRKYFKSLVSGSVFHGLCVVLLVLLILAQPIVNSYRFQNPFFPAAFWVFKGHEGSSTSTLPYLPRIPLLYNGMSFAASASELDPIVRSSRGIFFQRTVHMQNPPESNRQPADYFGNRWIITGGSNGILYGLLLLGAILTISRNRKLHMREFDRCDAYLASLQARLMLSFVITILLPQTLELRYYLFNLYVPCFVAVSSPWRQLRWAMQGLAGLGVAFSLVATIVLPLYFWTKTHVWLHDRVSWELFYQRPSSEECARVDTIIRENDSNRRLEINAVKASVLCHF